MNEFTRTAKSKKGRKFNGFIGRENPRLRSLMKALCRRHNKRTGQDLSVDQFIGIAAKAASIDMEAGQPITLQDLVVDE